MIIATWNVNSIKSRLGHVLTWCEQNRPDVLCLQETKCVDAKFPHRELLSTGFTDIAFFGERSYNGVAILSRHQLLDVQKNFPDDDATASKRFLAATINGVRIVNAYVPHGTAIGTEKFALKLDWLRRLRSYFDENFQTDDDVVLCADLNVAPHELDVWKVSLWVNKMHFTKPERDAIRDVKRWGFVDVFRQINDETRAYSWWDYFNNSFEKDRGLRLDHIWASPPLAETCTGCWIDKAPRALERPSDHTPVVAEFGI